MASFPRLSLRPARCLLFLAPLAACASSQTEVRGGWIGTITPVAGTCDPASQAWLHVHNGVAHFTPGLGTLDLTGTATGNSVSADAELRGMDGRPYRLAFRATRTDDTLTGTYITPRCRASVSMHPATL
jgi:hypothetical protein